MDFKSWEGFESLFLYVINEIINFLKKSLT